MKLMLSEIAKVLDGVLVGDDVLITSVGVDSRKVVDGMLFFAIKAARNGHGFAQDAINQGAQAAVFERDAIGEYGTPTRAILVDSTQKALSRLASWWRHQFSVNIIAVVGSNGKTTTKEMIASILSAAMPGASYATPGNFNNDIGVPLSLFGLNETHQVAVIEIGMNHPGEVDCLADIVRPHIAVMTNAQREHMAFFSSLKDVARSNAEVFQWTDHHGLAVLNADDEFCDFWADQNRQRTIITYGLTDRADIRANYESVDDGVQIDLLTPKGHRRVNMGVAGEHNVRNALGAVAAAWAAGIDLDDIVEGLSRFVPVNGRLQFKTSANGATVIDDTYNANPDSMEAAINVLSVRKGCRILIVGDMGETGQKGLSFHAEIGKIATTAKIDMLLSLGELSREAGRYFDGQKQHFNDKQTLIDFVKPYLTEGTTVLVKGSRFMKMEEIVSALTEKKV